MVAVILFTGRMDFEDDLWILDKVKAIKALHCEFFGCRNHNSQSCAFPGCSPDVKFTSVSCIQLTDVVQMYYDFSTSYQL